eukprot:scaffold4606_cov107-Isochrysis_galbana.AAC.5
MGELLPASSLDGEESPPDPPSVACGWGAPARQAARSGRRLRSTCVAHARSVEPPPSRSGGVGTPDRWTSAASSFVTSNPACFHGAERARVLPPPACPVLPAAPSLPFPPLRRLSLSEPPPPPHRPSAPDRYGARGRSAASAPGAPVNSHSRASKAASAALHRRRCLADAPPAWTAPPAPPAAVGTRHGKLRR